MRRGWWYHDSTGTIICTGPLPVSVSAFIVRLFIPPTWDSYPSTPTLPLAVYSPLRTPDPVLPPCTVLLLIKGLYYIVLGVMYQTLRAPHSFVESSWHSRTIPPWVHYRVWYTENIFPLPSQVAGISWGIRPYLRQRLSRNTSQDNSVVLSWWYMVVI